MEELYKYYKIVKEKEKQNILRILLGRMLTEIEPEFFKEILKYIIKNNKIIISQYNLTVDSYNILIHHNKLGYCVKIKNVQSFLKIYERFYDKSASEAMSIFFEGLFTRWIDYLKPEEREIFNKDLFIPLLDLFKRKDHDTKIKIHIPERFKEELIKNDIQIPPKALHFIPYNLVRLHPEYFEYASDT